MKSDYKRVLTIQDISCVGQCSLTVALPILSACGHETAILPSAVLSTHTCGFTGYTFRDLTDDIPSITDHWEKENIKFDSIYTGYLGSITQIDYVRNIFTRLSKDECIKIVDPAMADNGKLYPAFDMEYANEMKKLCADADYILPNITEACLLGGIEYKEEYDESYIKDIISSLDFCKKIILTGVSFDADTTGVMVCQNGKAEYYRHKKVSEGCHGTGDVYSSAFTGALMKGKNAYEAAKAAADYTLSCIEYSFGDNSHKYGVKFEPLLGELINSLK